MRAIVVDDTGHFDMSEVDRPTAGANQVLVEVVVSGVNFMDALQYRFAAITPDSPLRAGVEGVGIVAELGDGVTDFQVGQRVGWLSGGQGSFADFVSVEADKAVAIPDSVDDETAAALLLQGMTAHYLATDSYAIQPGDSVLVHAASGGVGQLLTQVAKIRGGRVIGTVSSPQKEEAARAAGADQVVSYDSFAQEAREFTHGEGVAAVYDSVGAATLDGDLAALRVRGTLVSFGGSSGPVDSLDLSRLSLGGSLSVVAPMVVDHTRTREELNRRATDLFAWVANGHLRVNIGGRYPLERAGDAITALTSRATTGKLILTH